MRRVVALCLGLLICCGSAQAQEKTQETDLDRAVIAARRDSSHTLRFYSEFVYGLLYVPVASQASQETGAGAGTFRPLVIEHEGSAYVPAFDKLERLQTWARGAPKHKAVAGYSLVAALVAQHPNARLLLNPGTEHSREFQPKELTWLNKSLQSGQEAPKVARGTEVVVGSPAFDVPDGLLTALITAVRAEADVQEAYLSQFDMAGRNTGLLLTLSVDKDATGRTAAVRKRIGAAVQEVLPEGTALSIGLYNRSGLTQNARETGRLIYSRKAAQ